MSPAHEDRWTTAQVARFMGLSEKTIRNRLWLGQFPTPEKQGRLNAFIPSEIVAYRDEQITPKKKPVAGTTGQNI